MSGSVMPCPTKMIYSSARFRCRILTSWLRFAMRSGRRFLKLSTRWLFWPISSVLFFRSPIIVIRREGEAVRVGVHSWHFSRGFEAKEISLVESGDVSKLLSAIFATHADRWVERFEPDYGVLDGYSWTMDVYAGNRYSECGGDNYAPDELVDLLYVIHQVGLPLIWNGSVTISS